MQTVSQSPQKPKRKRARVAAPRKKIDPRTKKLQQRFGLHLRELMDKKGLSAGDLHRFLEAEEIEISVSAVTKWMRGEGFPNVLTLAVIAQALGVSDYRKVLPPPLD